MKKMVIFQTKTKNNITFNSDHVLWKPGMGTSFRVSLIWCLGRLQSCQVGHPNFFWIIQFSFFLLLLILLLQIHLYWSILTRVRSRTTTTAEDNGDGSTFVCNESHWNVCHDKMDRRIEVKCWCTNLWTLDNCSFWPAKFNHFSECTLNPS